MRRFTIIGLASSKWKQLRALFLAALVVVVAIAGCDSGSNSSDSREPAKSRVGGGDIHSDRLEESVLKKNAVSRPGK